MSDDSFGFFWNSWAVVVKFYAHSHVGFSSPAHDWIRSFIVFLLQNLLGPSASNFLTDVFHPTWSFKTLEDSRYFDLQQADNLIPKANIQLKFKFNQIIFKFATTKNTKHFICCYFVCAYFYMNGNANPNLN